MLIKKSLFYFSISPHVNILNDEVEASYISIPYDVFATSIQDVLPTYKVIEWADSGRIRNGIAQKAFQMVLFESSKLWRY